MKMYSLTSIDFFLQKQSHVSRSVLKIGLDSGIVFEEMDLDLSIYSAIRPIFLSLE